ncbi:hypothetical protein [Streptomyces sp. NPDC058745]|uniref:hypothetical protein n=1 Tax=Streptomyces sp. NPDC058745 TaxID=3346621 RepID=UPI0036809B9F
MTVPRSFWFPDNTVLCNFACVDRIALLERILNGRGRWTAAVAYEARRSASIKYRPLQTLIDGGALGEPIDIEDDEVAAVQLVRVASFGGVPEMPLQHLGEAETLYLMQNRREFKGVSTWISDDRITVSYARRQGLTVMETIDLMAYGCSMGDVVASEAFELLHRMDQMGRSLRLPGSVRELTN